MTTRPAATGPAAGSHGGARPALSLKARALQWLAQREHSRTELKRKLLRRARLDALPDDPDPAAVVEQLLDWLASERHLSPERFVESRVHARSARWGNVRIRHELAQHGLVLDANAARDLDLSELDRARAVWARRFGSTQAPAESPGSAADARVRAAERARQMRFLAGRGFSADVARRVVSCAAAPDDD